MSILATKIAVNWCKLHTVVPQRIPAMYCTHRLIAQHICIDTVASTLAQVARSSIIANSFLMWNPVQQRDFLGMPWWIGSSWTARINPGMMHSLKYRCLMNDAYKLPHCQNKSKRNFRHAGPGSVFGESVTVSHYTAAVTSLLLRLGRRPWELMATVVVAYVSGSVFYDSCISCSDFIWSRLDMSPDKWPVRPLGMFCWLLRFLSLRKGILRSSIFPLAIWSWNWKHFAEPWLSNASRWTRDVVQEKEGRKGDPERVLEVGWVFCLEILSYMLLPILLGHSPRSSCTGACTRVHGGCSIQREWFLLAQPCCEKETDAKVLVATYKHITYHIMTPWHQYLKRVFFSHLRNAYKCQHRVLVLSFPPSVPERTRIGTPLRRSKSLHYNQTFWMIVPPFAPFPLTRQGDIKTGGHARGFAAWCCLPLCRVCCGWPWFALSPAWFWVPAEIESAFEALKDCEMQTLGGGSYKDHPGSGLIGPRPKMHKCMQKPSNGRNGMHPRASPKIPPSWFCVLLGSFFGIWTAVMQIETCWDTRTLDLGYEW